MRLLPPQEKTIWRIAIITLFLSVLGACGMVDYEVKQNSFFSASSAQKEMAVIRFHYSDSSAPHEMHVRRIKGGVAMQSELYANPQGDTIHFTASGTMERQYFMGIEGRFSF